MAISKTGKTLVQFNAKNGQFKAADGAVSSLTYLTKVSLDKNLSTKEIYGDGELQLRLVNDKGFTGTLGMTARDIEFEKANEMQLELSNGLAEIQQLSVIENAIYFETEFIGSDKIQKLKKVWLFGVEISAPSESLDQTTEDNNINNIDYSISVKGTYLKDSNGTDDYIDADTGRKVKVFKLSAVPGEANYDTFGDSVPIPTAKAA